MSAPVFGIDYSRGRPSYDALVKNGVRFVMRYISHDASKDLDHNELAALRQRGIGVGLVFESGGKRALSGFAGGRADALFAYERVKALGMPATTPVYFAVDWDASDHDKPQIGQYLHAAGSVLTPARVGVYGSYYVVRYAEATKACGLFWQTYAWSGGLVHPAAHLYQYSNGHTLAGVSCDFDKQLRPNALGAALPVPPANLAAWYSKYGPKHKAAWVFAMLRDYKRRIEAAHKALP